MVFCGDKLPVYVCVKKKTKLTIYAYEISMYACIINNMCEKLFHDNREKWNIEYNIHNALRNTHNILLRNTHYVMINSNNNNLCKYLFAYSLLIVSEGEDLCIC